MIHNPSLRQETRNQRAAVIPMQQESSILDWLESTGRLLARDNADFDYLDDEEEINELMENDGGAFDTDDDDDDLGLDDE
jgi:phosphopantothenoylcysteine synthetase/decarboxylase